MVAAKLDHSRVLVTKFCQNRLTLKGRSAGQRHTHRQTSSAENNGPSGLQLGSDQQFSLAVQRCSNTVGIIDLFLRFLPCMPCVASALCSCTSAYLCCVKDRGNDKYKKLEYKMAIGQYHRALLYLKAIDASQKNPADALLGQSSSIPLSPEMRHDVDRLYSDCQSNLAGNALFIIRIFST